MRALFLDIDGPMIPGRMYYTGHSYDEDADSFIYDPVAVGMINQICSEYGARIVFNSAHNVTMGHNDVKAQAEWNGLEPSYIHTDYRTGFPNKVPGRLNAIYAWLTDHPEIKEWVAVDDEKIESDRAIKIDFETGIVMANYFRIEALFGKTKDVKNLIHVEWKTGTVDFNKLSATERLELTKRRG